MIGATPFGGALGSASQKPYRAVHDVSLAIASQPHRRVSKPAFVNPPLALVDQYRLSMTIVTPLSPTVASTRPSRSPG